MTRFKSFALAAALVVAGISTAQAAVETSTIFLPPNPTSIPGSNFTSWAFSDVLPTDDGTAPKRLAGDTFDDFFIFNVADTSHLSFFASNLTGGLNFDIGGFHVAPFGAVQGTSPDFTIGTSVGNFVNGGGVTLETGVYTLELTGTYLATGASYLGQISASPVPEPEVWMLMLAGGAVGALARRRKQRGLIAA